MPTERLAIIADDLTGALDAAAPFAGSGLGVAAATAPEALTQALVTGAGVVAVSTRSRELGPGAARERVAGVLAALPPGLRIVKKIDSRLKGNIAAELEPFADRPLVVLPAIPDFGRVVRKGALEGFGIDRWLMVRSVLGRFAERALVPDTESLSDMIAAVAATPAEAVLVGARGLTQALATLMGLAPVPQRPRLPAPVSIAVGSTDPITLSQVAALRAADPRLRYIPAPAGAVPPRPLDSCKEAVTLIQITPGPERPPDRVAGDFAAGAAAYLRDARSMILTGGRTAEAILDELDVHCLDVQGEVLPGMAYARAGTRVVVTKSGGFGGPDALVRLTRQPEISGVR